MYFKLKENKRIKEKKFIKNLGKNIDFLSIN